MLTDTRQSRNAKVTPVDGLSVTWTRGLWKERTDTCAQATVPQLQHMFENKEISHVLENFRICAGEADGEFDGTVFGDGDFYKWMEAAVYTAAKNQDEELFNQIDSYIDLIGKAQLSDGYLSTKQIIGERNQNGVTRMGDINDFEVYNFGHLFTAACLHKRLTGKDSFLKIAVKTADYLEGMYADALEKGEVQTAVCPSHYMGLVEMYRTTGEERYLKLAEQAIALRDSVKEGMDDNQDRIPLREHEKIIGHAVRANYLYAGVADLCLEEDDEELKDVLHKVWRSLVDKKLYLTGGCGALYNGTSPYGNFFVDQKVHQAYGYEYQLPNITAYNETCASLGGVFWAYRMFQMEPKAEYFDVLERMMLNTNLAALSMDGKRFFYENMLRRTNTLDYELIWPRTRSEYILSYCCPPNLARTIAQSSEYAYLTSKDALWVGMYGASRAEITLENGAVFTVHQETEYPYDGKITFTFETTNRTGFSMMLRIPGWADNGRIQTGGKQIVLTRENAGSYYEIRIEDPQHTEICLELEMPVRYTVANTMVEETAGQAAVERGPLVYCCETADVSVESLDDLYLDPEGHTELTAQQIEGRTVTAIKLDGYCVNREVYNRNALYQTLRQTGMEKVKIRMIPYFAWDNREFGEMRIWFPILAKIQKTKETISLKEKKIVVLDDDPTGVQTVHDVPVYTDWEMDSLQQAFSEESNLFFILTNSRSFSKEETKHVHETIAKRLHQVSQNCGKEFFLISRGDSTLRGHYPLETEVLRETLETLGEVKFDGEILCPFFLEGGRVTIDNVHYVKEGNILIPAGMTEFAKDQSFGYQSSDLTEYVEEKTNGRYKKEDCITISLEELRADDINGITGKLMSAHDFQKIIVNATTYEELQVFVQAFVKAAEAGKQFLARTAASFPKVLGGISDKPLLKKEELVEDTKNGGIVLIGSHVKKTTLQLEALKQSEKELCFLEFHAEAWKQKDGLTQEARRVREEAERCICLGKTAVIYTSRTLQMPDTEDKDQILAVSVAISEAVTSIIGNLEIKPRFIVAKGGITSSDVGTKALGVKRAQVLGQIKKGIPVWRTGAESKFPGMPYIIFPGNVGEVTTLKEIVEELV